MDIVVNGQTHVIPPGYTAAQLITDLGLHGRRVAMEINQTIVPRSAYAQRPLQAGDRVEIVHAVGGG
ncbi:MAG: sulfur carrier protein ThiS [Gammaproteobacteria bacterium]|nr:sulfur carrier protein ThiS [Gammaproteobacteria bacterium]